MHRNRLPILKRLQDNILRFSTKDESAGHQVSRYTLPMRRGSKKDKTIKKISYSKTCLKRPLKNRQNNGLKDNW